MHTIEPSLFKSYTTQQKWEEIERMLNTIASHETAFNMRRRLNPHHPTEQAEQETMLFRAQQYKNWIAVNEIYAEHRDELSNTCDNYIYMQHKKCLKRSLH